MATFDTVLEKYIGALGFWQWMTFLLINLTIFGNHSSYPQLASLTPDHHCAISGLTKNGLSQSEIRKLAIPKRKALDGQENSTENFDNCKQYVVDIPEADNNTFTVDNINDTIIRHKTIPCEDGWYYDTGSAPFRLTFSQAFNLVCHRKYFIPLSSSVYFIGSIIGRIFGGYLGDRYGRKPVIIVTGSLTCISGIIGSLSPNIWVFCFIRFFMGLVSNAATVCSIVVWSEITNDKHRNTFGFLFGIQESFVTPSCVILVAYLTQDWRYLMIFMSALYGVAIFHTCFLLESPRWLLCTGRLKEAFKVIRLTIRLNGRSKKFSKEELKDMEKQLRKHYTKENCLECKRSVPESWRENKFIVLLTKTHLRKKTLPVLFIWIVVAGGIMGLQYYSVRMKHSDPYFVAFVGCTFTIPGLILKQFLYHFFDRKRPLIGIFIMASVICLIGAGLRGWNVSGIWDGILATVALGCFLVAQNMCYAITAESFPTIYRSYAMGLASGVGRVGAALSTFVERLDVYVWSGLPLTIFGIFSILAAITVFLIPSGDVDDNVEDLQVESPYHSKLTMSGDNEDPVKILPRNSSYIQSSYEIEIKDQNIVTSNVDKNSQDTDMEALIENEPGQEIHVLQNESNKPFA